jgi:hypothetical protein
MFSPRSAFAAIASAEIGLRVLLTFGIHLSMVL